MKIVKYSKTYEQLSKIKNSFYLENQSLLKDAIKINKKYIKQPKRKLCKNCGYKIQGYIFINHLVKYTVCKKCTHLNGIYKDTNKFTNWLYYQSSGDNYKRVYQNHFNARVKNIYLPKVQFLKSVLKKKFSVIDFGSGGGFFLKALELLRIPGKGFEVNQSLVRMGNKYLKKNKQEHIKMNQMHEKIYKEQADVLTCIGVLEHLENPNEIIDLFLKSNMKFLYISVPLFSLSSFLENSFKNIYPRLLSGGHTHLYTKESLNYMAKENNLEIVGEWWFGTDIPDLHRSLLVSSNSNDKLMYSKLLNKFLFNVINKLQHILDKNHICSEVHMILKKKKF